jgi:hypothetical protein
VRFDGPELVRLFTALPPLSVDQSEYAEPPYYALPLNLRVRAVVNVPAAADPAANAGGIALALAVASTFGIVVPVLTPATVGGDVLVTTLGIDARTMGVVRRLRVGSDCRDGLQALRVWVTQSTREGTQPTIDASITGEDPENMPTFMRLIPGQQLEVRALNLDPHSAYLVEVGLDGWTWPVESADDSRQASLLRRDQALDLGQGRV